jgi:hypothetical protein
MAADSRFDLFVAQKLQSKWDNARSRGIEFDMSFQAMKNILQAKHCHYTGVALTDPAGSYLVATDRTIDRVDSSKGYVKGNVVACCHAANKVKSEFEAAGLLGLKMGAKVFNKTIKHIQKADKK